jgi:hypothetical protein
MAEPPGITRRPSLLLISPRGARLLADLHGESPWPYVRRAQDARDHCWHVVHDLEANGFFIDLALASRLALREGVLLWIGEETCRADRRLLAKEHRRPVATPDGAGSYLMAGHVIRFDLEWDRGTASLSRLEKKVRTTIRYFKDRRNAERHVGSGRQRLSGSRSRVLWGASGATRGKRKRSKVGLRHPETRPVCSLAFG